MTQISRWFVRAVSVLAIAVLCACPTPPPQAYTPVQSATLNTSVEDARNIVLKLTKPPALFWDPSQGTDFHEISNVDIQTTRIRVTFIGDKVNSIPLNGLTPSVFGRGTSGCGQYMDGYTAVALNKKGQAFYFTNPTAACTMVSYGESTPWTRALTSVRNGAPDIRGEGARQLADALLVLKIAAVKSEADAEAHFQEVARDYRASATKPQLPEAAHRFRVQAEAAINEKDFAAAADLYQQALDVAPWWPTGHFDRALVLAESDDYPDAIIEMKRYLTLVPDATDARKAQDKIYEWERKV